MAGRPRKDGSPSRVPNKRNLTELYVRKVAPELTAFNVWDGREPGLVLRVHPSGAKAFKSVYSIGGRARWYHIGAVPLADARRIAQQVRLDVAHGKDPAAERRAERNAGTFAELAERYVREHAKRKNKSWQQADYLVRRYLLQRLGKLGANSILRKDVRAAVGRIESPSVANQVRAAASAIFSWGVAQEVVSQNPCRGIERHATKSRERVLSDAEIPQFWAAFELYHDGTISRALKALLILGQRPGEVKNMRHEHIVDGWWTMPGAPDPKIGWPGTKNGQTHRVWLPEAVRAYVGSDNSSFVFAGKRGGLAGDLGLAMRDICARLGVKDKVTPHDLRRTHGSTITKLGFGRDAMNRIQNHKEGGIADVYDRHKYEIENRRIMESVANHIVALAEGRLETGTVVRGKF
jgi:integrase